uniref:Uncharacterized protein n=1 Tax=Eptatretus burgeri TaxID=7764 RepID=A0A8C4X1Y6_EPTBU
MVIVTTGKTRHPGPAQGISRHIRAAPARGISRRECRLCPRRAHRAKLPVGARGTRDSHLAALPERRNIVIVGGARGRRGGRCAPHAAHHASGRCPARAPSEPRLPSPLSRTGLPPRGLAAMRWPARAGLALLLTVLTAGVVARPSSEARDDQPMLNIGLFYLGREETLQSLRRVLSSDDLFRSFPLNVKVVPASPEHGSHNESNPRSILVHICDLISSLRIHGLVFGDEADSPVSLAQARPRITLHTTSLQYPLNIPGLFPYGS